MDPKLIEACKAALAKVGHTCCADSEAARFIRRLQATIAMAEGVRQ